MTILEQGYYPGMKFDEYFSYENCSKHQLDALARSPAHFRAALEHPRARSALMITGQAAHTALLEPLEFDARYRLASAHDKRTTAGRAAHAEAENAGYILLKPDDWNAVLAIRDRVLSHAFAGILLNPDDGEAEVSIAWVDEETGVPCRGRPDFVNHAHNVLVDLKTTQDASYGAFARSCANYTYALQAAMYVDGMVAVKPAKWNFVFVAVETEPPYAVACYELDAEDLRVGRVRYRHALHTYNQCVATDKWPGYPEEIRTLELPAWARFVPLS